MSDGPVCHRTMRGRCWLSDNFTSTLPFSNDTVSSCSCIYVCSYLLVFYPEQVFFCWSFMFQMYIVFCFLVFGRQYWCNWLPGKTRLRNDLLCVSSMLNPTHSLTHSLMLSVCTGQCLLCSSQLSAWCTADCLLRTHRVFSCCAARSLRAACRRRTRM